MQPCGLLGGGFALLREEKSLAAAEGRLSQSQCFTLALRFFASDVSQRIVVLLAGAVEACGDKKLDVEGSLADSGF